MLVIAACSSSHLNYIALHNAQLLVVLGHEVVHDPHVEGWLSGTETAADTQFVTSICTV